MNDIVRLLLAAIVGAAIGWFSGTNHATHTVRHTILTCVDQYLKDCDMGSDSMAEQAGCVVDGRYGCFNFEDGAP